MTTLPGPALASRVVAFVACLPCLTLGATLANAQPVARRALVVLSSTASAPVTFGAEAIRVALTGKGIDGRFVTERVRAAEDLVPVCHLLAAIGNGLFLEYFPWLDDSLAHPLEIHNGMATVPNRSGLSLEFKADAIREYRVS